MTKVETNSLRDRCRFWQWPVVWSLTALTLGLGYYGFSRQPDAAKQTPFDYIHQTLQLFILQVNLSGPLRWQLQLARFLAPAIAGYTATQALLTIFREQLEQVRLQFFMNRHVVVAGLGRTGFKIATDYLASGKQVVIIEKECENDWIRSCEDRGAIVLIGDAADVALLKQARVHRARTMIVVCGSDGTNVEVAIRAGELRNVPVSQSAPILRCRVHIVDADLRALFKSQKVFKDTGDSIQIHLFNVYDASARLLLEQHPLDRDRIGPDDPRAIHLIVIGFGQMGESVVLQAAKIGHYANGKRLQITVVDQIAEQRKRSFYVHHPQFDLVCDIKFVETAVDDPALYARVADWCGEMDSLPTVAVCFDDDIRCLSFALNLLPKVTHHRVPISIRTTTDGGLTALVETDATRAQLKGLVRSFALIQLGTDGAALFRPSFDARAIAIHNFHRPKREAEGGASLTVPAMDEWDTLDEDLKEQNRQQADHIAVKLRAFGYKVVKLEPGKPTPPDAVTTFPETEVEIMARMEHARWNAVHFIAGWREAPGRKNIAEKTHPCLIKWSLLDDEIKEYDRESSRVIPELVKLNHSFIYRG